jgi:hypothetical protein
MPMDYKLVYGLLVMVQLLEKVDKVHTAFGVKNSGFGIARLNSGVNCGVIFN